MSPILTPAQRAASALRRAEKALRNWQDDPNSPRNDVNKMLAIVDDLRGWVQAHVLADIERAEHRLKEKAAPPQNLPSSHPQTRPQPMPRTIAPGIASALNVPADQQTL